MELIDINDTTMPYRAVSSLKRAGIDTLNEVAAMSDAELLQIRNIGIRTLSEIRMAAPFKRPDGQSLSRETPIVDAVLSIRATNSLYRGGLRTVGDIYDKSDKELLAIKGFGATSLAELCSRFPDRVRKKPTDGVKDKERFNAIVNMRIQGATLAEIGAKFGISRERVRQICKKAGVTQRQYTLTSTP